MIVHKADLPSSSSVKRLLDGDPKAIGGVMISTGLRSILIFPGILLAGVDWKKALLAALLGSIGITSFVILYIGLSESAQKNMR